MVVRNASLGGDEEQKFLMPNMRNPGVYAKEIIIFKVDRGLAGWYFSL